VGIFLLAQYAPNVRKSLPSALWKTDQNNLITCSFERRILVSTQTENTPLETEWIDYDVAIPSKDGTSVREKRTIKIPIYHDLLTGEEMLTEEAVRLIDSTKSRFMGLLLPTEIRDLRAQLKLTQVQFAAVLGLGAKTPARWETGRERPSQSLNLFLKAIKAKAITTDELVYLKESGPDWAKVINVDFSGDQSPYRFEGAPAEELATSVETSAA
jgi:DNA-binding transcriptional regulator YiaG